MSRHRRVQRSRKCLRLCDQYCEGVPLLFPSVASASNGEVSHQTSYGTLG
jgi:hypothetical protein